MRSSPKSSSLRGSSGGVAPGGQRAELQRSDAPGGSSASRSRPTWRREPRRPQDWKSSVHPCVSGERTETPIRNQWVNGNEPGWGVLDYRLTRNQWGDSGQFRRRRQSAAGGHSPGCASVDGRSFARLPPGGGRGGQVRPAPGPTWAPRGTPPMSSPTSAGLMHCLPAVPA